IGTVLAPWMRPPEAIDPHRFGVVGKPTDVYHAALLLLAVLHREVIPFTESDIVAGVPQQVADRLQSTYSRALGNALHPHVLYRTQTPLEFWREIQASQSFHIPP